jgi:hypothetical protein
MPTVKAARRKAAPKGKRPFAQLKKEAHILAVKFKGGRKPAPETPVKPGDLEC